MADKTTGELDRVRESPIGGLPGIMALYADTLIPVEQQGKAMHMTGQQWADFGRESAKEFVAIAVTSAEQAKESQEKAAESERQAKEYSGKPPVIRQNSNGNYTWWTWDADAQAYQDSGEIAIGNVLYAVFYLDEASGELWEYTDKEYFGPQFELVNDADLEVVLYAS